MKSLWRVFDAFLAPSLGHTGNDIVKSVWLTFGMWDIWNESALVRMTRIYTNQGRNRWVAYFNWIFPESDPGRVMSIFLHIRFGIESLISQVTGLYLTPLYFSFSSFPWVEQSYFTLIQKAPSRIECNYVYWKADLFWFLCLFTVEFWVRFSYILYMCPRTVHDPGMTGSMKANY